MASESNSEVAPQKDGLALVVGGLFILALVFAAYNYFSKGTNTEDTSVTNEESAQEVVVNKDEKEDGTKKDIAGSINGNGAMDEKDEETVAGSQTDSTSSATEKWGTGGQYSWAANNYNNGDIKGANYTVKSGDTLWEVAEGVYGDGTQWTKILDANKGSIGFLPNGSQALIFPGQVLVLP